MVCHLGALLGSPNTSWYSGSILQTKCWLFLACLFCGTRNPKLVDGSCCLKSNGTLAMSSGRSMSSLGARTSRPTEPRSCRIEEVQIPPTGSLGIMVTKATPTSTLWFLEPCILSIQYYIMVIGWMEYCVLETVPSPSWCLYCTFKRLVHHSLKPAASRWQIW